MRGLNRDTVVALVLLALCAVFIGASFEIRQTSFGQMESSIWPRIVLAVLTALVLCYLGQSLRQKPAGGRQSSTTFGTWLSRYRNALWCYGLFLAFLLTLPILGMLIGGILFVFCMLTVLGGSQPRQLMLHGLIASISFGAMWAIFTFGLRVMLPQGVVFSVF